MAANRRMKRWKFLQLLRFCVLFCLQMAKISKSAVEIDIFIVNHTKQHTNHYGGCFALLINMFDLQEMQTVCMITCFKFFFIYWLLGAQCFYLSWNNSAIWLVTGFWEHFVWFLYQMSALYFIGGGGHIWADGTVENVRNAFWSWLLSRK